MGLHVITPINSLGYGIAGLNIVKALEEENCPVTLWPIGPVEAPSQDMQLLQKCIVRQDLFDVSLSCLRIWHQYDMSNHVGNGVFGGLSFFELDMLESRESHHLANLDICFTPSKWAKFVINRCSRANVKVCPLGVDMSIFYPEENAECPFKYNFEFSGHNPTVFFNIGKWEYRKGHDVVIRAFNEAFTESDNVMLVMVCDNPFIKLQANWDWENLYRRSKLHQKIKLLSRLKNQEEVARIMQWADCGIFPSRAEGWNLPLLEALACGKQVIATNYSSHTEFLTKDNALLIEGDKLELAYDGVFFSAVNAKGRWLNITEEMFSQLVNRMRDVHERKQTRGRQSIFNQAGVDTARQFTWNNTARVIMKAFNV